MNNKLILAPNKESRNLLLIFSLLFLTFPFFACTVVFLTPNQSSLINGNLAFTIILICVSEALLFAFIALLWMQRYKTYELDEEGLNVRFWKYKKRYFWEEFAIKKIENYESALFFQYSEGVVFSTKQIKGSGLFSTHERYSVIHFFIPLASPFFIDFKESAQKSSLGGSYRVDKEEFLTTLKYLGVEIEQG